MKIITNRLVAIAVSSFLVFACESKTSSEKTEEKMETKMEAGVQYTCPMHPEVITDKPGSCPKCGMDLVKKTTSEMDSPMTDSTSHSDSSMKM